MPVISMDIHGELDAVGADEVRDLASDHDAIVELPACDGEMIYKRGEDAALEAVRVL